SNNGKGRVFQSDGKEVKLTLTGYFWRYGIRKAIQVSIFRMNPKLKQSRLSWPRLRIRNKESTLSAMMQPL
ncbi:hypothetical protein BOO26_20485, partial [Vibrio navarrensis]|nr:hypothetical protein [Vibrio navarrensis]